VKLESASSGKLTVSNVGGNIKLLTFCWWKVHAGGNIKAKLASPLGVEALASGNILWIPQDANFSF
jgi:hypothetical protein